MHLITSVKKGGTCDRGGVRPGMVILGMDGIDIRGMNMKEVRRLSVGSVGSKVTDTLTCSCAGT